MEEELAAMELSPLFCTLDRADRLTIVRTLTAEYWHKGSEIRTPRMVSSHFRLIVRGRVKVVSSNAHTGREISLQLLGPGDVPECVDVLENQRSSLARWALDDVRTLLGYGALLEQWIDHSPAFRTAVHRYMGRQLREANALASDLALRDTRTRLAKLLLRHLAPANESKPLRMNLIRGLSHEELANLVGSTRVVVSRVLGELRRDGIADVRKGSLHILDFGRLEREALA